MHQKFVVVIKSESESKNSQIIKLILHLDATPQEQENYMKVTKMHDASLEPNAHVRR